jgi:hypothetical protein
MPTPYIILVIGFALLAALCLWFIKEIKGKWMAKFVLVPAVIWYGLFLYFVPSQITGYPSDQDILQEKVLVRFYSYEQPSKISEGAVFVVVDTRFFKDSNEKNILDYANPSAYSDISDQEYLRLYRLPWDEKMVQNMNKAQKKKQVIILSKNKNSSSGKSGQNGQGKSSQNKGKKTDKKTDKKPQFGKAQKNGEGSSNEGNAKSNDNENTSKYTVEGLTPNVIIKK